MQLAAASVKNRLGTHGAEWRVASAMLLKSASDVITTIVSNGCEWISSAGCIVAGT